MEKNEEEEFEEAFDINTYMLFGNYGQCLVVKDLLQSFFRENESSVTTQMALSTISNAISTLSSTSKNNDFNPLGVANSYVGMFAPSMMLEAKIEDLNRAQDIISMPVNNSADDISRQDNIIFQKTEISDYRDKERLARFFHAFGINLDSFLPLLSKQRENFWIYFNKKRSFDKYNRC